MARYYTDKGVLSKGASLNIQDDDGKYFLLVCTTNLPATASAPNTIEKTVLTDSRVTQVEGLQTMDQKEYTFNYHRDNIRQLMKYAGKTLSFIERNADDTGEKFTGSFAFGRSEITVNGLEQGTIYVTVNDAEEYPLDDVRDIIKPTAIITTPLNDVKLTGTGSIVLPISTSPNATVKATSDSESIATVTYADDKLTITAVAKGNTFINLETSATGEATSYRSIAVSVE